MSDYELMNFRLRMESLTWRQCLELLLDWDVTATEQIKCQYIYDEYHEERRITMIPHEFDVYALKDIVCNNCGTKTTCLISSFNGRHESEKYLICMECIKKEFDDAT